jgi:hypothetical protein
MKGIPSWAKEIGLTIAALYLYTNHVVPYLQKKAAEKAAAAKA